MIQLTPVYPQDSFALSFIEEVYTQSFPPDERREFAEVKQLLIDNPLFHITLLQCNGQPAGFIAYWLWNDLAYIEHFAIAPSLRGAGHGAAGLKSLLEQLHRPVVLEVEPPIDSWAHRRIGFYQRIGFELCPLPYTQPPYSPEKQSVALLLMSYGMTELATTFDQVVSRLYRHVYGTK